MIEHTKNKSIDKSPARIRPPDGEAAAETEWAADLSLPQSGERLPRWLSVEQVRKMQRMRRQTVLDAMRTGELPFERRGRISYIRLSDVLAWEEKRVSSRAKVSRLLIHPDLAGLA
jgi:hypothetical protein